MNLILLAAVWGIVMMLSGLFIKKKDNVVQLALLGSLILVGGCFADLHEYAFIHSDFKGLLVYDKFSHLFLLIISIAIKLASYFLSLTPSGKGAV